MKYAILIFISLFFGCVSDDARFFYYNLYFVDSDIDRSKLDDALAQVSALYEPYEVFIEFDNKKARHTKPIYLHSRMHWHNGEQWNGWSGWVAGLNWEDRIEIFHLKYIPETERWAYVIAHEIGHSIGIKEHSDDPENIMTVIWGEWKRYRLTKEQLIIIRSLEEDLDGKVN